MATSLSVFKKSQKLYFCQKKKGARPTIHIYLESVSPEERDKHIYMYFFKTKNGTFVRKKNGATGLKLGMQTQLDCE